MSALEDDKKEHIHFYVRSKSNKNIYRCQDPYCPKGLHYTNKDLLLNKRSICHSCHEVFILDAVQLDNKRPKCLNCANTKQAREYREAKEKFNLVEKFLEIPKHEEIPDAVKKNLL